MNQELRPPVAGAGRTMAERSFPAHDGTTIFFRHWSARGGLAPVGAVLLLHRGHEHGGRMAHLVEELGLDDVAFYAWDARGHGRSGGERGAAPDLATLVRDLDGFVRHLAEADGLAVEKTALVAQSVGAVIAATWVHDYAPDIRAMVLAAPAFDVRLYVPLARRALALRHRAGGDFRVNSFVRPAMLTSDPARAAGYAADPLVTRAISAGLLLDLYATAARVVADARAITAPTLLLISGADAVVNQAPQHRFFVNLGSPDKAREVLPDFRHDTLGERDRAPVVSRIAQFLHARLTGPVGRPSLLDADRAGFTRDEAEALASPLAPLSAAGLRWAAARAAVAAGARLSQGLALGRETGFDSGSTLDYVYRNQPEGFGPLGRLIDRNYLDSVGWRGIRERRRHVEELIALALARLLDEERPRRILDIAAGHGRYVLEAVRQAGVPVDGILLRDASRRNVEAGRRLVAEAGLGATARFELGDAFDADDLARLDPRPTLAIVSGLYELFPENEPVRRSLAGLARAVPPGGWLVYTCQPWHPQLELIARALTSHRDGRPWVMRRRTQAEMDELAAAAGFRKVAQRIDRWGIFTVALARRDPS